MSASTLQLYHDHVSIGAFLEKAANIYGDDRALQGVVACQDTKWKVLSPKLIQNPDILFAADVAKVLELSILAQPTKR